MCDAKHLLVKELPVSYGQIESLYFRELNETEKFPLLRNMDGEVPYLSNIY